MASVIRHSLVIALGIALCPVIDAGGESLANSRRDVVVPSGTLELQAVMWSPAGRGPFPAVVFAHGGGHGRTAPTWQRDQEFYRREPEVLGPLFARHGYVFLYVFRRGTASSAGQGTYSGDLLDAELAAHGVAAMNRLQVRLLESVQADDIRAGVSFVRALPNVDARRVALAGHSFGGSLVLLVAEQDSSLRAVVDFAEAAASWKRSPELRARLRRATTRLAMPVFFIHAANDYTTDPGAQLAAVMKRLGKPHRLLIYPPFGTTTFEGHNFVDLAVTTWEPDVFAFLDKYLKS